ncbi:MAG: cysteine desulfurase family protein [Myxococcota bacterium]
MDRERPIYLDHHATTPCDPRVVRAMQPYWTVAFGNPASRTHRYGWEAEHAVEIARRELAALIGASSRDVVFTSGATEANNLAILGIAQAGHGHHLVTCATEHRSVLDPCRALEKRGFRVSVVGVSREGRVDLDQLAGAIEPDTGLVSIMLANNEIGAIQPLAEIAKVVHERGALLHSDASQAAGRIPVDVKRLGVDLLSWTAHKLYGPKGIGALWVRRRRPRIEVAAQVHGGGHERGLRSGTLPVPLCVGFGEACALARRSLEGESLRLAQLRDRLLAGLCAQLSGVERNGPTDPCLPGSLNLSFSGVEAEALLLSLPDLALSSGSACTSGRREPSHVLWALGLDARRALSAIRFGIGRFNTEAEIDRAIDLLVREVERLRGVSRAAVRR